MKVRTALVAVLLTAACELKENSPPPADAPSTQAPAPRPVDTIYRVDTVTLVQVDTVFVTDTIHDTVTVVAEAPAKTAKGSTKTSTKSATKTVAPVVVKKPVAVTKAPVDTRSLPAVSTTKTAVKATTATTAGVSTRDLDYLRSRNLLIPVPGIPLAKVPDNFLEKRGSRQHSALDFMAARGTPVVSTDAGTVAKIHTSVGGGLTLYLADPSGEFIYYYAHLDRYKPGIKEGDKIAAGEVIGYVGSTGNAVANAPHLHFAIGKMDAEKRWWKTTAIDPKPLMARPSK